MTKEESYIARILLMYKLDKKIQTKDLEVANIFCNQVIIERQEKFINNYKNLCQKLKNESYEKELKLK